MTALSPSTSSGEAISRSAGGDRGADQLPDLAHGAEEAVGGVQPRGVTIAGSSAQVAGRSRALPKPAASASTTSARAVGEDEAGEGERADQLGGDRAAEPARAVDQAAEQRAEQHRRGEVGDQDRGRAPGRAELLVGQQQQRDVAGAGPERALEMRGEEPAGARAPERQTVLTGVDCMAGILGDPARAR